MYIESIQSEVRPSGLVLPKVYQPKLKGLQTEKAIQQIDNLMELGLKNELHLQRINAPLFVQKGIGVNDNLNGVEHPVSFKIDTMDVDVEVVQSLAKWKRIALRDYHVKPHEGIYTDMHAIRSGEYTDNTHSILVDQWDWEMVINREERNLSFLQKIVRSLFKILRDTESFLYEKYDIKRELPDEIKFVHAEELLLRYPDLEPREREKQIVKEYGAVFLIGIGGALSDGKPQDGRSPDYDDWSTPNEDGYFGLNGDLLVWNSLLGQSFELSSMGIRVDRNALIRQLVVTEQTERMDLYFHRLVLNDEVPLSIGGGIGKSRTGMYLLKKAHIGEISRSVWPKEMIDLCNRHNISLL